MVWRWEGGILRVWWWEGGDTEDMVVGMGILRLWRREGLYHK